MSHSYFPIGSSAAIDVDPSSHPHNLDWSKNDIADYNLVNESELMNYPDALGEASFNPLLFGPYASPMFPASTARSQTSTNAKSKLDANAITLASDPTSSTSVDTPSCLPGPTTALHSPHGYLCTCDLRFRTKHELDSHTQELQHKAWQCQQLGCVKSYSRMDSFNRHKRTHSSHVPSTGTVPRERRARHPEVLNRVETGRVLKPSNLRLDTAAAVSTTPHTALDMESDDAVNDHPTLQSMRKDQSRLRKITKCLGAILGEQHSGMLGDFEDEIHGLTSIAIRNVAERLVQAACSKTKVHEAVVV